MRGKNFIRRTPLLLAIPPVILMRLLSPLVLVRIGQTNAGRIGHFAMDIELSLLKKRSYAKSSFFPIIFDFYFIDGTPSNSYLMQLWQKEIMFYPKWLLKPIHRLNIKLPGSSKYHVFDGVTHTDLTLLDKFEPILKMSQEDENAALSTLKEIGISRDDKIVCLCVRDSEYLRVTFPDTDWSEHDHRDSDIDTYVKAAELLAKMGYKVFRMGNIVRDKLESDSSSVIDYANSNVRSEMLDIYLFSHADFVITTSTGMDFLGALFRIPIGIVNAVSLTSIYQGELLKCYQPKEIVDTNSGQQLGLEELIERGYQGAYNQSEFACMNIGFIDNSSDDLCKFFSDLESLVRNKGTEQYSPKAITILEKYKITNKNWAKLSPAWLTSHSYFLAPRRY